MNKLIILIFFVSLSASATVERTFACFSSEENKVNVKFVEIYDDGVPLSYVQYSKSKAYISLGYIKTVEEETEEGRPAERNTTWVEIVNGKVNGEYTVMSQGARYYDLTYKGLSGKVLMFTENLNSYNADHSDCAWN